MNKLAQYIFLFALIGTSGYFVYFYSLSPCEKTFEYSIGRFDTQFGVSKEEFRSHIVTAETVWEKALGRDIFNYNLDTKFKINLIYDERQLATIQKQKTEFGLSAVEDVLKKLDAKFNIFKDNYDQRVSLYEKSLALFKERKSIYDKEVNFLNKRGGASKEKYESLEAERIYLNKEAERLNTETVYINNMSKQLDALIKERNVKAIEYNRIAENYNKKYNGGLEFNQAEYKWSNGVGEINVYQFGNKDDLILAISHELGHALGMGHIENSKSIMYYLTGANTETALALSPEDLAELKRVCK